MIEKHTNINTNTNIRCAPEVVERNKFTAASDRYAFGMCFFLLFPFMCVCFHSFIHVFFLIFLNRSNLVGNLYERSKSIYRIFK